MVKTYIKIQKVCVEKRSISSPICEIANITTPDGHQRRWFRLGASQAVSKLGWVE